MRLRESQIKSLCQKLLETLRARQLIHLKRNETEVLNKMEQVVTAELKIEDDINREAEALLEKVASQAGGSIDREKMFQLIKRQLVKERNVVL